MALLLLSRQLKDLGTLPFFIPFQLISYSCQVFLFFICLSPTKYHHCFIMLILLYMYSHFLNLYFILPSISKLLSETAFLLPKEHLPAGRSLWSHGATWETGHSWKCWWLRSFQPAISFPQGRESLSKDPCFYLCCNKLTYLLGMINLEHLWFENLLWWTVTQTHPCYNNQQANQLPIKQHTFHVSEVATDKRHITPLSPRYSTLLIVGWLPSRYFQVWHES